MRHWKQKIYDNRDEAVTEYCNTPYDEVCYLLAETDELDRIEEQIEKLNVEIVNKRKYGRANILFIKLK